MQTCTKGLTFAGGMETDHYKVREIWHYGGKPLQMSIHIFSASNSTSENVNFLY